MLLDDVQLFRVNDHPLDGGGPGPGARLQRRRSQRVTRPFEGVRVLEVAAWTFVPPPARRSLTSAQM